MAYCEACIEKDLKIAELKETIKSLPAKRNYRQRKEQEGYFGASTPSSKVPFKENAPLEKTNKKGGAVPGHKGHGRRSHTEETADGIILVDCPTVCPECGGELVITEPRDRAVIESTPTKPERLLYRLPRTRCKRCRKRFRAKPAGVLPRSLYGNRITAQLAVMHYVHGIPIGRISEMTGINAGSIIDHHLFRLLKPVREHLVEEYRRAFVKHADETGWRNDGQSGYAWLFCTAVLSISLFRNTRSASVPRGVFGEISLPGVLVVDRYNGYNKLPVRIRYCYEHLLRDVEKLKKDFPDDEEVARFTSTLIPLLAEAMHLQSREITDKAYYRQAGKLKKKIMAVWRSPARHPGIRATQDIFTIHENRLFHWVADRRVPADNNRAERDLRPTVIARKVSFGSSSEAGAETRSVLMSVLHTLNKRRGKESLDSVLKTILDEIARDPQVEVASLIPPAPEKP